MPKEQGTKPVAQNKKARHDYHIEDTWEAGLVLMGTEVKSLRQGRASLVDGYAFIDGGEIWVWDGINPAAFLFHGGVLWDTANNVTNLLGSEDVDALEAASVPEPASLGILALGALAMLRRRR